MAQYLIDYENVFEGGLNGIANLTEDDGICIFYSEKADHMTFGLHKRLGESKAAVTYQKVEVGTKNALDFQLATYLGYLICQCQNAGKSENYFIVTKDNGFSVLSDYWKRKKITVSIISDIMGSPVPKAAPKAEATSKPDPKEDELTKSLKQILGSNELVCKVKNYLKQSKNKQELNTLLNKSLKDGKKVSAIFKAMKKSGM